jgi:hypothetical protein
MIPQKSPSHMSFTRCLWCGLFFINDADDEFGSGFVGAVTGTGGLRVTHMLYADDLTLADS